MDIRAVLRELARVYISLIQRDAAPCDVDVPGRQLDIHIFLFYLLHLEVPAQQIAYRYRKLNIETPELAVRHIGHGEGVDVQPRAAEPFYRKLVHLALRGQNAERRRHVEIQRVIIPER